ncbi:hypothetical protein CAEBREN_13096 [Caenorhabditis brenneri]|uniref:Domain of unknown function WSN domain-containing protein n=1 Tax=Caenorhabditis brenneri TaxID=135651 RepID=G0NDV0_CAEBE|nr:hypothetical protein CAEBREN_13096 [Caenorhabditis brenneri]
MKNQTLLRISELLGAHHRLAVGINFLTNLIKTAPLSALADYTGSKIEVFEDLLNSDLEEILEKLKTLKTENLKIDNTLKAVEVIKDMEDLLENVPPFSNESVKEKAKEDFKEWVEYSTVNLTVLEDFSDKMKMLDKYIPNFSIWGLISMSMDTHPACKAVQKFPGELKYLIRKLKNLPGILNFEQIVLPIRFSLVALEAFENNKLDIPDVTIAQIAKISSGLDSGQLNRSSKSVESIKKISSINESPINLLEQDLNGVYLRESLAEGNELTILKKVFEPVFKTVTAFGDFLRDDQQKNEFLKEASAKMEKLIGRLIDSSRFRSDLHAISSKINTTFASDPSVQKFQTLFKSFSDGLKDFKELQKDILEFEKEEEYKVASTISGFETEIRRAVNKSIDTKDSRIFEELKKNETFISLKNSFENVIGKMKEFNTKAQKVHVSFASIGGWETVVNDAEKLAKNFFKTKNGNVKMEAERVISTLEFIKSLQDKDLDFDEFNRKLKELKTSIKNNLNKIKEEFNFKNLTDSPTYQEISKFQEPSLAEKLANGEFLFRLFHKFLTEKNSFEEVFKAIDKMSLEMDKVSYDNNNRYKILRILEQLGVISPKIDKMKAEILKRKERYDGKINEELIDLRWLVENLHEVLSPEYRISELLDFSKLLPDELDPKSFQTAANSTFDLDFAQHQKNLKDTYRPLTALRLLHQEIVAHELLSQRPSFWEENIYWLISAMIVAALCFGSIAIFVLFFLIPKIQISVQSDNN